jgi:Uma2 family endonuclease
MGEHKKNEKTNQVKEQQGHYDIPERFEIINGVRYDFLASPKVHHQQVVGEMYGQFYISCRERGVILVAPMDVHFDEGDNIAQPDLIFIANENRAIIRDGFVFGAPDLVVEVLSESTGRRDKTVKRALYERFGVKEYWIVDPVYRTVDQLLLVNGTYQWVATLTEGDVLISPQFECISFTVSSVFPADP